MLDTLKFGNFLSRLIKKSDMTQSDVAEKLNITRQAKKWILISILII